MKRVRLEGGGWAHLVGAVREMATAVCGVHPHWPGVWIRSETAGLPLCPGCEVAVQQGEGWRQHAVDQGDQVSRGETALYTALAEISVARAVMEGPGCGGDCCPLEVETEDSQVELAGAERSIRHALRVLAARRHRLDVVLEEEA